MDRILDKSPATIKLQATSLKVIIKIKLKGLRFDSDKDIEMESKIVLNIFTRNNFEKAFNSWKKGWELLMP